MGLKQVKGKLNVYEAAKVRIKNIFSHGVPIRMSTSGGKDSIVMSSIVYELIQAGEIDPKQLVVQFIDEEAMFDDVIEIVKDWRKKFLLAGAGFEWYCVECRHANCLNLLSNDESFILWDRYKKDSWVRPMPKFAIKHHPLLKARQEQYHPFLDRINKGKITMIGVRADESLMRRDNIAKIFSNKDNKGGLGANNTFFPIYDWTDDDVWFHILNKGLDFPETYMQLYQVGVRRNNMRISQFLSVDTARNLVKMGEYNPNLLERITRREPNAYLAFMYWESEMFRRPRVTKENKEEESKIDYKAQALEMLRNPKKYFISEYTRETAKVMKKTVAERALRIDREGWKQIYLILVAGDIKSRQTRAVLTQIVKSYSKKTKKEMERKEL